MKRLICSFFALLLLLCGCAATQTEDPEQILQQRRDTAEAHMRHMMSVLWQTDTQILYSTDVGSMGVEADEPDKQICLEAGKLYSGMPYTHGSGSAESFLSYGQPDENGVYQLTGLTSALLSGGGGSKANNMARLSNDCADAVSWAWARVGASFSFTMTQNMTEERGCLPVGTYTTESAAYKKTKTIAQDNGETVMFAAYACLKKADAVVTYNGSGHAMMVSQVQVVRSGETIDPEQSYVLVHEQFTGNYRNEVTYVDETSGQTVYCLGGVDRKYTFSQLFKKGYLPVTIRELIDPAPVQQPDLVDSVDTPALENLFEGTISCLHKIGMVTVTITDGEGKVVQQATCFPMEAERHMFRMYRFTEPLEQQVMKGSVDLTALKQGSYHCEVTCQMGNGAAVTVRAFDFSVQ